MVVKQKVLMSICAVILSGKVTDPLCKKFAEVIEQVMKANLKEGTKFDENFMSGINPDENLRSCFPGKADTWKLVETCKEIRGRVFLDYKHSAIKNP
jgi:hypothetical protein